MYKQLYGFFKIAAKKSNFLPVLLASNKSLNVCLTRNYLLETTKVKLLNAYTDSLGYITSLDEEHKQLVEMTSSEVEMNKINNKNETFQRLNQLGNTLELHSRLIKVSNDFDELNEMLSNDSGEGEDFKKLLLIDLEQLAQEKINLKLELIELLVPDELEDKENAILELSAGVGGLESRIFCSELYEMYRLYSESQGWSYNTTNVITDQTDMGEMMSKASVEVSGVDVYKYLKYESGVHRVQRVPKTEAKGRIHTSTVGVVVTPKPSQINIEINPKDLKIETKTSGGPGGQHANKTESSVM